MLPQPLHSLPSRFREDCKKLAYFVHRVEAFLMETEEEADMTQPGWQAAFAVSIKAGLQQRLQLRQQQQMGGLLHAAGCSDACRRPR